MTYKYNPTKVKTTCDNCKKILRSADKYETLNDKLLKNLCPSCFQLWLDGKIGELKQ